MGLGNMNRSLLLFIKTACICIFGFSQNPKRGRIEAFNLVDADMAWKRYVDFKGEIICLTEQQQRTVWHTMRHKRDREIAQ